MHPPATMVPSVFTIIFFMRLISSEALFLPLTHTLSNSEFNNTHHLLRSIATSSAARHSRHAVSLPLSSGGDYTLSFSVGQKPSQSVTLYMDTGSDLVWFPCHPFQCILCEGKPRSSSPLIAIVNITSASPVSCRSPACAAAHSSTSSDLCAIAACPLDRIETSDCSSFPCPPFYYAYGDGSLIARLYTDRLAMGASLSSSLVLSKFMFGCAHSALAEPVGVAGFGRGVLSLPAQLAGFAPELGSRFSYCLVAHSFDSASLRRPSPLILGKYEPTGSQFSDFAYTRMLSNPKHPYFYSVGLIGISLANKFIPAPASLKRVDSKGNGGVVVDSGTTFTMLPTMFFNAVAAELNRRLGYRRDRGSEARTGLALCYGIPNKVNVPTLALIFGGNSSVVLPRRNYWYEFFDEADPGRKRKVGCLMLMDGGDEPYATLGNYQQQGFEVLYDLVERRVGFARRECASLWDSLNHG